MTDGLIEERFSRQSGIVRPGEVEKLRVAVVGAGGIGSWTTLLLAKMGVPRIDVYDFDVVEEANLASQVYTRQWLGTPKVAALARIVGEDVVRPHLERFERVPRYANIVVAAVDNMTTRGEIWDHIKGEMSVWRYFDARMGGQVYRLLSVRPYRFEDVAYYERPENLHTDEDSAPDVCSERAICFNTAAVAAHITKHVKRVVSRETVPLDLFNDLSMDRLVDLAPADPREVEGGD